MSNESPNLAKDNIKQDNPNLKVDSPEANLDAKVEKDKGGNTQKNDNSNQNEQIKSLKNIKNINFTKLDYLDSIFKCGINIQNNNEKFYDYIKNGLNISTDLFDVCKAEGDSYYFYRCLSEFLYGKIDYFDSLRKAVLTFCKVNTNEIFTYKNEVEVKNGIFMNTKDYISNMDKNSYWSNDIDITVCSFLFNINIALYKYSDDKNNLIYIYAYIYDEDISNYPLMILINENNDIFNLVIPKAEVKENNIEETKNEEIKDNIADKDKSLANIELNHNEDFKTITEMLKKTENVNIEKILAENVTPFPKYTTDRDEDLYFNIFKFLFNGIKNGKRTWPDYIEIIKDRKIRDQVKLDFYKKMGLVNVSKSSLLWLAKNRKKYRDIYKENNIDINNDSDKIINLQDKYLIENSRLHVVKYEGANRDVQKKYIIPYLKEIDVIIKYCHDNKNHQGIEETVDTIKSANYFWVSIRDDVDDYIKNCTTCDK